MTARRPILMALAMVAASGAIGPARSDAADLIVAPGAVAQPLAVTAENESQTVWLLDASLEATDVPPFVMNLSPLPAAMSPSDIAPLGAGTAYLSFDVDGGAVLGTVDTLRFRLVTSAADTIPIEVRLVVAYESATLTPPYVEDFESGPGAGVGTGSWQWGTPTSGPGGAASGSYCWATNLAGDYPDQADDLLYTPPLDFSGAVSPRLTFNHWYDFESGWDGGAVLVSTDGGASYTRVAPFGGYPGEVDGAPAFTGRSDPGVAYRAETFFLGDLPATSTWIVAFQFGSDASIGRPGWYLDDIVVSEGPDRDFGVSRVDAPPPVVGPWGTTTPLIARVRNYGTGTYAALVRAVADTAGDADGSPAAFRDSTTIAPLAPGAETTVTFNAPLAALAFVPHRAKFTVALASDAYAKNDTASVPLIVLPVRVPPVYDSFEGVSALGAAGGIWALGTPSGGPGSSFDGTRCWGATLKGGYPTGADEALFLGGFDLSALARPRLRFRVWYDLEAGYDGARVLVSNDGATWTPLTSYPGYNGPVAAFGLASGWTGASGGWLAQDFDLTAYAGEPRVVAQVVLGSDASGPRPGVFVDSLTVDEAPAVSVPEQLPRALEFAFAGANPAPGPMRLRLALPRGGMVKLEVFDVTGRREAVVVHGPLAPGVHHLEWSGRDARGRRVSPGLYLLRATTPSGQRVLRGVALR